MTRARHVPTSDFPYHITARCTNREWFDTPLPKVWETMQLQLYFMSRAFNVRIHSFVLLSNHFHMIASTPDANLSEAMRYFMTETSRDLLRSSRRINQTYGSRFHRSLIKSNQYFMHAYKYVYRNPVHAGLCQKVEDYPFSTLRGLIGLDHLLIPLAEDTLLFDARNTQTCLDWLNTEPQPSSWEEVRRALRRSEFYLGRQNSQPSELEIDML